MEIPRPQRFLWHLLLREYDQTFALNLTLAEKIEIFPQLNRELLCGRWHAEMQNKIRSHFIPLLGANKL